MGSFRTLHSFKAVLPLPFTMILLEMLKGLQNIGKFFGIFKILGSVRIEQK